MAFDTTRFDARRRVRGSLALAVLLAAMALLVITIYPSIAESSADIEALIESFPESFREGFGVEAYSSIEGFLSAELYSFTWVLLMGLYMAYTAAGTFAGDIDSKRLYLVLSAPVSRRRLFAEKSLAILTPLVVLNLTMPVVVFGGTLAVGYPIDPALLLAVHIVSVPYHLVCVGIGQVLAVAHSEGNAAQVGAIATVFVLFLVDSVTAGTDYEDLGAISPTRYVDPTDVLLHETVAVEDALLLLAVALALFLGAAVRFQRRDL